MKGHEIAENLRNTELKWTRYRYYNEHQKSFCVLGLKAHEFGVSTTTLKKFQSELVESLFDIPQEMARRIAILQRINDKSHSKEELILELESLRNYDMDFPVEEFIEWCKSQKMYV
jgi:hypothetical protein